jgi:hypothetical protein
MIVGYNASGAHGLSIRGLEGLGLRLYRAQRLAERVESGLLPQRLSRPIGFGLDVSQSSSRHGLNQLLVI